MWPLNCVSSIYRVASNNPYQCIIVRCSPYRWTFAVTIGPLRDVDSFNSRNISRTIYYPWRAGAKRPRPKLEFPVAACDSAQVPRADVQVVSFIVHLSRLDACSAWHTLVALKTLCVAARCVALRAGVFISFVRADIAYDIPLARSASCFCTRHSAFTLATRMRSLMHANAPR